MINEKHDMVQGSLINLIENDEVYGKIYKTYEYDKFKNIKSNRRINPLTYNKLLRSMKEKQLIIPICVNEKMEIIDGQHRFKAEQTLGLPVYYFVLEGYSMLEMKRANLVASVWKKDDFLNAYINEDYPSYIKFYKLKTEYLINTVDLIRLFSKIKDVSASSLNLEFEEGKLEVTEEEVDQVLMFLECLEDFSFFKEYKMSRFISAFMDLYFFKGYDHERMKQKLETRKEAMVICLSKFDYLEMLANKIYSYASSKNSIYFDGSRKKLYRLK